MTTVTSTLQRSDDDDDDDDKGWSVSVLYNSAVSLLLYIEAFKLPQGLFQPQ